MNRRVALESCFWQTVIFWPIRPTILSRHFQKMHWCGLIRKRFARKVVCQKMVVFFSPFFRPSCQVVTLMVILRPALVSIRRISLTSLSSTSVTGAVPMTKVTGAVFWSIFRLRCSWASRQHPSATVMLIPMPILVNRCTFIP